MRFPTCPMRFPSCPMGFPTYSIKLPTSPMKFEPVQWSWQTSMWRTVIKKSKYVDSCWGMPSKKQLPNFRHFPNPPLRELRTPYSKIHRCFLLESRKLGGKLLGVSLFWQTLSRGSDAPPLFGQCPKFGIFLWGHPLEVVILCESVSSGFIESDRRFDHPKNKPKSLDYE